MLWKSRRPQLAPRLDPTLPAESMPPTCTGDTPLTCTTAKLGCAASGSAAAAYISTQCAVSLRKSGSADPYQDRCAAPDGDTASAGNTFDLVGAGTSNGSDQVVP